MIKIASTIRGGEYTDARGKLIFFNDFDMKEVRRFYVIEHPDTNIVRAWQAHKKEQKWFYVIEGSFKIIIVKPPEWLENSEESIPEEFILESKKTTLLHVPGGYANGFRALEPNSKLMVFSDYAIADAGTDEYRFDKDLWYQWE